MNIQKYKKKLGYTVTVFLISIVVGAAFSFSDYRFSGNSLIYNNPIYRAYRNYQVNTHVRKQIEYFKETHSEFTYVGKRGVIYPETERVEDLEVFMATYTPYNPEDITYARHSSDALGLSLTYPESWVLKNEHGKHLTIAVHAFNRGGATIGLLQASHFAVGRSNLQEREENDLRDAQYYIDEIKERNGTHESVIIGGLPADKYLYSIDGHSDQVAYLVEKGEYLYLIEYETQINLTPEFDKILASIAFTDNSF